MKNIFRSGLSLLIALGLLGQSAWVGSPGVSQANAALNGKALLTKNDFKYIGSFQPPMVGDDYWTRGFTLRHIGGELHAFVVGFRPPNLYEYKVPDLSMSAPYPSGTFVKDWGYVGGGKAQWDSGASSYPDITSIFWDETDKRIYWNYLDQYNAIPEGANNPTVGFSVINDAAGTITHHGPWRFTGLGPGWTGQCTTSIPSWFATSYTGGKRIGSGCGNPVSGTAVYNSDGPTLTTYDPPNPASYPGFSSLPYKTVVGYPVNLTEYTVPSPVHRNMDYYSAWTDWNPKDGVGYCTRCASGVAVWIDLPTKSGLFYFPSLVKGRYFYYNAAVYSQLTAHEWWEYDPADLAAVAAGSQEIYQPQPAVTWQASYPIIGHISEGFGGPFVNGSWTPGQFGQNGGRGVSGAAFDPTTNRLYLAVKLTGENGRHLIHVYQVGDNIAPTPPPVTGPPTVVLNINPSSLPDLPTGNGNSSVDTAFVTWYSENATSVTLSPGDRPVANEGTLLLKQTKTTTYVITATNAFGTTTQQATVTMNEDTPSVCGNKICEQGETVTSCPIDCAVAPTPPTISAQPQDASVSVGRSATFNTTALNAKTYQWQKAEPGSSTFNSISGANGETYVTSPTQSFDNGSRYLCEVTNPAGSVKTTPATLTVTAAGTGAPQLNLLLPINGLTLTEDIVLAAYYSAGDLSSVASLKFQLDSQAVVGTQALSGVYVFPNVAAGAHTLKAYFVNSSGTKISGTDVSVSFTTQLGGLTEWLPAPTLKLPDYIPVNGRLSADYPSGYPGVEFQWTLTPKSNATASSLSRATAVPAASIFQTPSNTANLGVYPLTPGTYKIGVQAFMRNAKSDVFEQDNVTLVSANFSGVKVYPNPWRKDKHGTTPITFDQLPMGSEVKIFTVSGHWVKTLTKNITTATWNLTNGKGDEAASGIYLYVIKTDGGDKITGQVHVIK